MRDRSRRRPLTGEVTVPGDKSISHRALLIAALAPGTSRVAGLNDGDDVARTATALAGAGVGIRRVASHEVEVQGSSLAEWHEQPDVIDAGNSGSTARMLLGILAAHGGAAVVTGDASLRARPMLRVVAPLRVMGAAIEGRSHGDRLPLVVRGGDLRAIDHELSVASAQVKTALLLAGMNAAATTSITEPLPTRNHTELMLASAGVRVERHGATTTVAGGQTPAPIEMQVPGDVSAAMFLAVAASLLPGSDLTIRGVGLNPSRTAGLDILTRMGARIRRDEVHSSGGELSGDLRVIAADLTATEISAAEVAGAIDEIPALAIAAARAAGRTVFQGVHELRAKESDRLDAIVSGLTTLGVQAAAEADTLVVEGTSQLHGGSVDSKGDHRIAMAFAVAGMVSDSPVRVSRWSCVETSFPGFLDVVGRAQGRRR